MRHATAAQLRNQSVLAFANAFVVAALNRQLHERDSRWVRDALEDLVDALRRARQLGVEMPLLLQCSDDRLFHDGEPLDGPSLQARSLLRRCGERQIAMFAFAPGLDADEANRLFDLLLLRQNAEALSRQHREAAMSAFGIRNVRISLRTVGDPGNRRADLATQKALHQYQDLADSLQQNHALAHHDQELAVTAAADAVERTLADFDEPSHLLALATQDLVEKSPEIIGRLWVMRGAACRTCSKLSMMSNIRRPRTAADSAASTVCSGWARAPSARMIASGTCVGSFRSSSGTNHTPSGNAALVASPAASASRVLPTPGGPIRVTSRVSAAASRSTRAVTSFSLPTKLVSGRGRLPAWRSGADAAGRLVTAR